jgi:hypothetical protein
MSSKSIGYYVTTNKDQAAFFDDLEAYELLEWAAALSQMALDARNAELAKPLDLKILEADAIAIPY